MIRFFLLSIMLVSNSIFSILEIEILKGSDNLSKIAFVPFGIEDGVEEDIIKYLRLKKLYVDYIIPATDRIIEMDEETGVEYKVVTKGAIILAVGYDNL